MSRAPIRVSALKFGSMAWMRAASRTARARAGADADEYEVFYAFIGFNNFVGDAGEGAADFVLAEDGAADGGHVLGGVLRGWRMGGCGYISPLIRAGCGYS